MPKVPSVEANLNKKELDTIRAMITYMLTEDTDLDDKFIDKLFNLERKFEILNKKLN